MRKFSEFLACLLLIMNIPADDGTPNALIRRALHVHQTAHDCSFYYIIADGYVSASVIASGCVNSLLKTYAVILLPSLQSSTIFLHHVKLKIHWDYYINMSYYQISMHFTVQIVKLATSAEIKVLISWILDILLSFQYGWWFLVFFLFRWLCNYLVDGDCDKF